MKRWLIPIGIGITLIALQAPYAAAQEDNSLKQTQTTSQQKGWLGVLLQPVPEVLQSQLRNLIPDAQGLLVGRVEPDSPAAKAGIQRNDVLLELGDNKLYSPAQLSSLVATSPGKKVRIQLVREGKLNTLHVTIGTREISSLPWYPFQRYFPRAFNQPMPTMPQVDGKQVQSWDSFESVQVKTLEDGRYHAEVSYKDPQGETKTFTFEGKKDEIINQIQQQKELPEDKRKALLDALDFKVDKVFGQPFITPFFQDPFFQGNPFDDPFFQRGFQIPPIHPWFTQPGMNNAQPRTPSSTSVL